MIKNIVARGLSFALAEGTSIELTKQKEGKLSPTFFSSFYY